MKIERKQLSGTMNLDDSNDIIPATHHKEALNVVFRGGQSGYVAQSALGNRNISYTLPAGTNNCIGHFYDSLRNRLYYFNYNSNGRNGIYYYDTIAKTITPVLVSFTNSAYDIFNFNPLYPISSANIIYKDPNEGDTLYWTDGNNRPCYLNIKDALSNALYSSGTQWQNHYLYVARKMPMIAPICTYLDDATITINNLKNTLYQFRYRWIYRDNLKSTWSPWSKLFAPSSIDSIANDIDPTKSNKISVTYNTGDADCIAIEIGARRTIDSAFSDTMSISTIQKGNVSNNSSQTFLFLNDSSYEYVDQEEEFLLFDYVPRKANAQELLNGSVILYGGITEGVSMAANLDVSSSVSLVSNVSTAPMTIISSEIDTYGWSFDIYGTPQVGDSVTIQVVVDKPIAPYVVGTYTFSYTVGGADTRATIAAYFATQLDATPYLHQTSAFNYTTSSRVYVYPNEPSPGDPIQYNVFSGTATISYAGTPASIDDVAISCYKHKSKYRFVLMYFDEFGVTDGSKTVDSMLISTPEMDTTGGLQMKIPNISFFINHQPPLNAKYFTWGRSLNLTTTNFNTLVSASTEKDTSYGYIEITNLQNNKSNFQGYDFVKGDRIRVIGEYIFSAAGTVSTLDFPIIDVVTAPTISGTAYTGVYIKVPYDASIINFGTTDKYYCETYTPSTGTELNSQSFYEFGETYEVGDAGLSTRYHTSKVANQVYGTTSAVTSPTVAPTATLVASAGNLSIGTYSYRVEYVSALGQSNPSPKSLNVTTVSGSQRVTVGSIQIGPAGTTARKVFRTKANGAEYFLLTTISNNSTTGYSDNIADASLTEAMPQGAEFGFTRGDLYVRYRAFPTSATLNPILPVYLLNKAASDLFSSSIAGNGRPFVIDPFATETYNPTLIRYGQENVAGTNLNKSNRFYPANMDEYDRQRGDIMRLKVRGSQMRVFQKKGCGMVGVLQNMLFNADGSGNISQSSEIVNNINYYQGDYGIGSHPTSLVSSSNTDYFVDTIRGYQVRLGGDGLTPISALYKAQYYMTNLANKYTSLTAGTLGGYAKILGAYDFNEEECVSVFQGYTGQSNVTIGFNEMTNRYTSFYNYAPEWIASAQGNIISFKNGQLWVHDTASTYCNYYATQYKPSLTLVFNDMQTIKKRYNTISMLGNTAWLPDTNGDITTNLGQTSSLQTIDFLQKDDKWHASFKRDSASTGGLYNGNVLKGNWAQIKLKPTNGNSFVNLFYIELNILEPFYNR